MAGHSGRGGRLRPGHPPGLARLRVRLRVPRRRPPAQRLAALQPDRLFPHHVAAPLVLRPRVVLPPHPPRGAHAGLVVEEVRGAQVEQKAHSISIAWRIFGGGQKYIAFLVSAPGVIDSGKPYLLLFHFVASRIANHWTATWGPETKGLELFSPTRSFPAFSICNRPYFSKRNCFLSSVVGMSPLPAARIQHRLPLGWVLPSPILPVVQRRAVPVRGAVPVHVFTSHFVTKHLLQ